MEFVIAIFAVVISWLWLKSRKSGMPPGPLCLPVIGNLHNVTVNENFCNRVSKLHKQYGPIVSLSVFGMGQWDVLVEGLELVKEVLHDNRFMARIETPLLQTLGLTKGIFYAGNENVKAKRKLTYKILRALGVGKTVFASGIEEETEALMQHLERHKGRDFYLQGAFSYSANNVIMKLLFNKSFGFQDAENQDKNHQLILKFISLMNQTHIIFVLPAFLSKMFPRRHHLIKVRRQFVDFVADRYMERKPSCDSAGGGHREAECVSDYIWDEFIKSGDTTPFHEQEIPHVLGDLFLAGNETTSSTLSWAALNLLHHPDVQEKVFQELKNEFPERDQIIPMTAAMKCHYLMATLHESQRYTPNLFTTPDHTANVDIDNFHGYKIPRGTRIFPQLHMLYRDPKAWKHPNHFTPENFLDAEGKFQKNQHLMYFSLGNRVCPGENIAKMEMYLYFANLVRRFKILPPSSGHVPERIPVVGFIAACPFYEVRLEKREC